ncbi:hypothetical protein D3C87_1324430 [compost metagenome]
MAALHHGQAIEAQQRAPVLGRGIEEARDVGIATRVVDKQTNLTFTDSREQSLTGIGLRKVLDYHQHFDGVTLLQFAFQLRQGVATARHQDAVEATLGEGTGKRRAHTMGGTGNHRPRTIPMQEGIIRNRHKHSEYEGPATSHRARKVSPCQATGGRSMWRAEAPMAVLP